MKENTERLIKEARAKELGENAFCPIPVLLDELQAIGTQDALKMARQIAEESLTPTKVNPITKVIGRILRR